MTVMLSPAMRLLFARGRELLEPAKDGDRKARKELDEVFDALESELDEAIERMPEGAVWPRLFNR